MKRTLFFLSALLLLSVPATMAQMPGNHASGFSPAMMKLFGKNNAFTAKATVRMTDSSEKETMSMVVNAAFLDGKMKQDVDLNNMKSAMMPAEMLAQMKQMGMDKVTVIVRPDKKISYLIYPGLKSYVEMPMSKEDADSLAQEPKIEKTELGKERVDGHPTVKSRVVMTFPDAKPQETTIWEATDLKNFPVQMKVTEKEQNILVTYGSIQFSKPELKQFEPPADFTRYDNPQKLMMEKMMRAPQAK